MIARNGINEVEIIAFLLVLLLLLLYQMLHCFHICYFVGFDIDVLTKFDRLLLLSIFV